MEIRKKIEEEGERRRIDLEKNRAELEDRLAALALERASRAQQWRLDDMTLDDAYNRIRFSELEVSRREQVKLRDI